MNFFEHQDEAQKKTKRLIFFFVLAVILITAAIYFISVPIFHKFYVNSLENTHLSPKEYWWQPRLLMWVGIGTLGLIAAGSAFMISKLSKGGSAVAEMLGGKKLDSDTKDPDEQKLRNVVEEMSIAAGTPVPEIFVLDQEEAINAFAAGFTPSDAAIGVTRGTLKALNRDELQGVIAHEFSHILHGDMKINIRLMGTLHGILLIAMVGSIMMRISAGSRYSRRKSSQADMAIIGIGLALFAIGYIGVFFGRLIKSALSRQREFLADAAAVQFTRNPTGIAGALKKIGGLASGSSLETAKAEQASHLFFGNALGQSWLNAMATHPPLTERIKRLDPTFSGDFPVLQTKGPLDNGTSGLATGFSAQGYAPNQTIQAHEVMTSVGNPSSKHLAYARSFMNALPQSLVDECHDSSGAQALIYALLIDDSPEVRRSQLELLKPAIDSAVFDRLEVMRQWVEKLGPEARLPLIDISLPTLRTLTLSQYRIFTKNLLALIKADNRFDFFEMVLAKVINHHLAPVFSKVNRNPVRYRSLSAITQDTQLLLSSLAHLGSQDDSAALKSFVLGWKKLSKDTSEMLKAQECDVSKLSLALDRLSQASYSLKQEVMTAATATSEADGVITLEEAELLRALGDTLNCPIPPMAA